MSQVDIAPVADFLTSLGVKVYDTEAGLLFSGSKESPVGNYAVVFAAPGLNTAEALDDEPNHVELDFQVTSVGPSPRSARWVADRVAQLANRDVGDGRVRHLASNMVRRDTDRPDVTVYFATDAFTLSTSA